MNPYVQLVIAALTIPALFLVGLRHSHLRRWGFIIGFSSQPFWLYATFSPDTFGMFLVSVFTTATWFFGIWTHWIRPTPFTMPAKD